MLRFAFDVTQHAVRHEQLKMRFIICQARAAVQLEPPFGLLGLGKQQKETINKTKNLKNIRLIISQDANITTSILTLKVTSENDNAELTCRATNPWFSGGAIEDKRIIRVACK